MSRCGSSSGVTAQQESKEKRSGHWLPLVIVLHVAMPVMLDSKTLCSTHCQLYHKSNACCINHKSDNKQN